MHGHSVFSSALWWSGASNTGSWVVSVFPPNRGLSESAWQQMTCSVSNTQRLKKTRDIDLGQRNMSEAGFRPCVVKTFSLSPPRPTYAAPCMRAAKDTHESSVYMNYSLASGASGIQAQDKIRFRAKSGLVCSLHYIGTIIQVDCIICRLLFNTWYQLGEFRSGLPKI